MSDDRCRTINGVHIPGCWGCVIRGHRYGCTCPQPNSEARAEEKKAEERIRKIVREEIARAAQHQEEER